MACLAGPSFQEGNGSWACERVRPARIIVRMANVLRMGLMMLWFGVAVFGLLCVSDRAERSVRSRSRVPLKELASRDLSWPERVAVEKTDLSEKAAAPASRP